METYWILTQHANGQVLVIMMDKNEKKVNEAFKRLSSLNKSSTISYEVTKQVFQR